MAIKVVTIIFIIRIMAMCLYYLLGVLKRNHKSSREMKKDLIVDLIINCVIYAFILIIVFLIEIWI